MGSVVVRRMRRRDIAVAAAEFGAVPWPGKDGALFESYLQQQDRGVRDVVVEADHCFAGYCCGDRLRPLRRLRRGHATVLGLRT